MRVYAMVVWALAVSAFFVGSCDRKPSISRDKVQEAWDDYNNPALLDAGAVFRFSDLPSSGSALNIPWADIYWPSHLGGIALRWKAGFQPPFNVMLPTEQQVRSMSAAELDVLSPAEKYDIFMGRFDYPTVQAELIRTHPSMPIWFGLCHGWASASVNFNEPGRLVVEGATGVELPFSSGDIKALLAYAQGVVYQPYVRALGQRCEVDLVSQPHLRNSASCRDTNAGSFHLILTNLVGRSGQQVIADLSRGSEVWNFPIYGYTTREVERRPPSLGSAVTAASEVVVETAVEFIVELEAPNVERIGDSRSIASEQILYQYTVELDQYDRVVGGAWISEERPDFLWTQEKADFRGYYGNIESLYERSIRIGDSSPMPSLTPTPTPSPVLTPAPEPPQVPDTQPLPEPEPSTGPLAPILTQPIPTVTAPPSPQAGGSVPSTGGPDVPVGVPSVPSSSTRCSQGQLLRVGVVELCEENNRAIEPVTADMIKLCLQTGNSGCYDPVLDVALYLKLRGDGFCPTGSIWSERHSSCAEGDMILGPFGIEFESSCRAKGFGNLCSSLKLHSAYFDIVKSSN